MSACRRALPIAQGPIGDGPSPKDPSLACCRTLNLLKMLNVLEVLNVLKRPCFLIKTSSIQFNFNSLNFLGKIEPQLSLYGLYGKENVP